jgi:hypothetical protein
VSGPCEARAITRHNLCEQGMTTFRATSHGISTLKIGASGDDLIPVRA